MQPLTVSVVVPVYNSEQTLALLVERLRAVLIDLCPRHEIILVNDGSRDDSWGKIAALAQQIPQVRGINLMRNFGQHNALLCGIRAAQYDVIVTLDDDLQNPPEEIPSLIARLSEGFDVVYGAPQEMHHGLMRNLASHLTKLALQGSMGVNIATRVSAFRAFRREVVKAFAGYNGLYVSIDVLLTWGTSRFSYVAVHHEARQIGVSNYTVGKLIRHALNMITGFSVLPLQIASLIGFAFVLFGVGVFAVVVGRYLITGESVPGFPFLASIIAIFAGVQLFALGIMGEYLARMHVRLQDRPAYTVREATDDERHPDDDPAAG
ncbi:MAG: glycosyltransferase family 2 protein [Anaerolineae bacterium]|nr:glycosyltransferase family 2 protein [Anaerolineae bacterium]NUQ05981.1 glycosyltransferase family 2 protein [Anaerolineae bacterium]